jgi:pimeloyl-ACP methyl ester carboxylesterase
MKLFKWALVTGMGAAGLVGGTMLAGAAYLLRRRTPDPFDPPTNYDLSYEEVAFTARDGVKLRGWWIPAPDSIPAPAPTVVVCPGQEGSIDGDTAQIVPLHRAGFAVLAFDFRGHGRSDGALVTLGVREKDDLLDALDYLHLHHGVQRVGVLGFSMGASAALMAAAESARIVSVVADSGYASLVPTLRRWAETRHIPEVVHRWFVPGALRIASFLSGTVLHDTTLAAAATKLQERSVLLIYGADDPFVSPAERHQLHVSLPCSELWIAPESGHRGAYRANPDIYNERVINWFRRTL